MTRHNCRKLGRLTRGGRAAKVRRGAAMSAFVFPEIDPVAVQLGPLAVRWYGLAYFAGILIGWWYARRLVRNERLWGKPTRPADARPTSTISCCGW